MTRLILTRVLEKYEERKLGSVSSKAHEQYSIAADDHRKAIIASVAYIYI